MKVINLSVYNYKSLREIEDIKFNDITTIIGENDSGKTSIMEFMEIMLTNSTPKSEDYNKYIDEKNKEHVANEIRGVITLQLDDIEKFILSDYLSECGLLVIQKRFLESSVKIEVLAKTYKDIRFIEYKKMKTAELKTILNDYGIEGKSNNSERIKAIDEYLENNDVDMIEKWIEIKHTDISRYIPRIVKYGVDDYNNPDNLIYKTLQEVFINEVYYKNENGQKEIKNEGLKDILIQVTNSLKKASEELLPIAQKINPNISELNVEPEIDLSSGLRKSPIIIKDINGINNHLSNYGYGTKKRMFMSVMEWIDKVVTDNSNVIKLYDEPDNNLHIEAQRKLFKTIRNACKNNGQAMICTHSPFIVDVSPIQSIRLVKKFNDGSTNIEYISEATDDDVKIFISNMCQEIGISNSHIFFEKCFIVVEGESEMNFIPIAYNRIFKSTLAEDGITLINLGGNGSALGFLKLLIDNKKDKILMILDKDSTNVNSKSVINNLKNKLSDKEADLFFKHNIIFIGEKEFEDCFSNKYIAEVLNNSTYKKSEVELWTSDEINNLRTSLKFSDEIKNLVNKNLSQKAKKFNYINKPILGTLLGNSISSETIPREIFLALIKAREIAEVNNDEFVDLLEGVAKLEVAPTKEI